MYSLKILYQHGVLPGNCIAYVYPDSQRKGWRYIKDWKVIGRCYNTSHCGTWHVSWLRHSPHVRSLPRAGLTLFPILLGCLFVCLVCLVTHRILSAVSSKARLLSSLLSVLNQPESFSAFLGPSCHLPPHAQASAKIKRLKHPRSSFIRTK